MAGEGSSGFTPPNPHGHCTPVQTDLLGHSLHLGARHVLQCSICSSLSLFQWCAFLHVKMQKCSFLSHQLLIAIIKRDVQAQQRQSSAALGAGASLSWAEDCQAAGNTHFVSHQKAEPPWAPGMCAVPTWAARVQHSEWDHPDQEMAQQYRWCKNHTAWGFGTEIWAILTGKQGGTSRNRSGLKQTPFFLTKVNFNLDPLADQILCEAAQTFLLAEGKQQEGAGTWERQKRQQRDLAGLLALDNSKCSWNYHVMWNCDIPRDCLNIGIKKYSMTSCTCPTHPRKTRGFPVLWQVESLVCRNPAFGNVWWYHTERGYPEFWVLDWQLLTGIPRSSISVQNISRNPVCQRANILKIS